MLTKAEGTTAATTNTAIKRETTDNTQFKKMELHETTDRAMIKWLPSADKEGKEGEIGSKIAPIFQETKQDKAAARENKTY